MRNLQLLCSNGIGAMSRRFYMLAAIVLLGTACSSGPPAVGAVLTTEGRFKVAATSNLQPIVINQMHTWTIHVETDKGKVVEDAHIVMDGGMPEHQHGLPTAPEFTKNLGGGDYLVEGVKFSMTGHWVLKFTVTADGKRDTAVVELNLE